MVNIVLEWLHHSHGASGRSKEQQIEFICADLVCNGFNPVSLSVNELIIFPDYRLVKVNHSEISFSQWFIIIV